MLSRYRALPTVNLARVTTFVNPPTPTLSLDSPASAFMTDFLNVHPVVVNCKTNVIEALHLMKRSYVRSLLVTAIDGAGFSGIVTATDINSGKVLAYMASNQVKDRSEVLVEHVMIDKEHIHGLDYEKVAASTIGDILETIKHLSEQHVIVVDKSLSSFSVRGIFSTTNIAKALHIKFDVEPQARTFFELEQVILHHHMA
jgi:DeoR family transcriptional regulator, catabolite repression regulator